MPTPSEKPSSSTYSVIARDRITIQISGRMSMSLLLVHGDKGRPRAAGGTARMLIDLRRAFAHEMSEEQYERVEQYRVANHERDERDLHIAGLHDRNRFVRAQK